LACEISELLYAEVQVVILMHLFVSGFVFLLVIVMGLITYSHASDIRANTIQDRDHVTACIPVNRLFLDIIDAGQTYARNQLSPTFCNAAL
jgi:hypothetical protein